MGEGGGEREIQAAVWSALQVGEGGGGGEGNTGCGLVSITGGWGGGGGIQAAVWSAIQVGEGGRGGGGKYRLRSGQHYRWVKEGGGGGKYWLRSGQHYRWGEVGRGREREGSRGGKYLVRILHVQILGAPRYSQGERETGCPVQREV